VHELDTQLSPSGQTVPQWPQLFGSSDVSVQPAAQHWSGDLHFGPLLQPRGATHRLLTQVSSGAHGMPQPPQFCGSAVVSVHPSEQHVRLPLQAGPPLQATVDLHLPATQLSPEAHGMPQPPQFIGSVDVSVQPSEQHVWLPLQVGSPWQEGPDWHLLSTQVSPGAQTWPQLPQLFASVDVSSQPVEQHWSSGGHAGPPLHMTGKMQLPPLHVALGGHALPQEPQFLGSLLVSAHPLAQH
jgi:hypothetical protein